MDFLDYRRHDNLGKSIRMKETGDHTSTESRALTLDSGVESP